MKASREKSAVAGYLLIPAQVDQEVLSLDHKQGGVGSSVRH